MVSTSPPPKGFTILPSSGGPPAIAYRTTGMGCVMLFFGVWLAGWTAGCVFLAYAVSTGKETAPSIWFCLPFWISEFLVLGFVLWYFFAVTTYTFSPDKLVVEKRLWRFARVREFPKAGVKSICQVKDGGQGEDSFPSWGLRVDGEKCGVILYRQPLDRSSWLGPIIAQWAGVPYVESPI